MERIIGLTVAKLMWLPCWCGCIGWSSARQQPSLLKVVRVSNWVSTSLCRVLAFLPKSALLATQEVGCFDLWRDVMVLVRVGLV